jgi:chromosome partitioning protein
MSLYIWGNLQASLAFRSTLVGNVSLIAVLRQVAKNLWLVGSHIDLAAAEIELAGIVGREAILRDKLAEMLNRKRMIANRQLGDDNPDEFDFLLIDSRPSLGVLWLNVLAAVDEVLLPLQPHFLALHGLSKLLQTIEVVSRRLNPRLHLAGVVSQNVIEYFKGQRDQQKPWSGAKVFQTHIRCNIRLAEAPSFGQSILQYAPESHGAEDYRQLADELLRIMKKECLAKSA